VTFSVDGKTLASAGDRTINLWDVASGKKTKTLQSGYVRAVAFSPDDKMLASGVGEGMGKQNVIKVWDVASGKHVKTLP
jgi:WD40 repeat protein